VRFTCVSLTHGHASVFHLNCDLEFVQKVDLKSVVLSCSSINKMTCLMKFSIFDLLFE
jgi:hypothetical protein